MHHVRHTERAVLGDYIEFRVVFAGTEVKSDWFLGMELYIYIYSLLLEET